MNGEELRRERIELGITQAELAAIMGTTDMTIARWERGERAINQGWARLGLDEARRRKIVPAPGRRGPRHTSPESDA